MPQDTFGAPLITPDAATAGNPLIAINPDQAAQDSLAQQKASFDSAIDTRNKAQLASVISTDPTSPVASTALDALNHINTEEAKFKSVTDNIDKAGGPGTPGGNIAAAQQFGFHPKLGSALVAYLMGQKEAAYNLATGGQEKDTVEFGKDGGRFYRTTNALGQTIKVLDSDGNELTPSQVQDLGIGYSSYEATQKAKLEEENKKARQDASNLNTKINNVWYGTTQTDASQVEPALKNIQKIKAQLSPKVFSELAGFLTSGTNVTSGSSSNKQDINTKNNSTVTNEKKGAGLNATAAVGGEQSKFGNLGSKANATAETGSSTTVGGTDQGLTGSSARNEIEKTLQTNKQALAAKLQLSGLGAEEQAQMLNAFDVMAKAKLNEQNLIALHKGEKPSFISLISNTQLGDQQSQLEAQMLQVLHNKEQMDKYLPYYNKSMDMFRKTGTIPDFGQIESAFIDTPEHKDISKKYGDLIGQAIARNAQNAEHNIQNGGNPIETKGAPPPTNAIPFQSPVARNAPVAPPRLSLDMIGKLYANNLKKS